MKEPHIAMLPSELPRQRIHRVMELPPRPASLETHVDWLDPEPAPVSTAGSPRKVTYLGTVEWAWSPAHDRLDGYYLNPRGRYWLLWMRSLDNDRVPWRWWWALYAWAEKRRISEYEAAVYMLRDAWAQEAESSALDHFHLIDEPGLLSVDTLMAIGRDVWPGEPDAG